MNKTRISFSYNFQQIKEFPIASFQLFYDAGFRNYVYNKSLVIFIPSNIRLNSKFT